MKVLVTKDHEPFSQRQVVDMTESDARTAIKEGWAKPAPVRYSAERETR